MRFYHLPGLPPRAGEAGVLLPRGLHFYTGGLLGLLGLRHHQLMIIMFRGFAKMLTSVSITMEGVARLHNTYRDDD